MGKCVASNSVGSVTHEAKLTVVEEKEAPEILRELSERDFREGQKAKMEFTYSGIPKPEVTWYCGEKVLEDARYKTEEKKMRSEYTNILTIDDAAIEDTGDYKAVVKNSS